MAINNIWAHFLKGVILQACEFFTTQRQTFRIENFDKNLCNGFVQKHSFFTFFLQIDMLIYKNSLKCQKDNLRRAAA